jgi:presenilin-like A22 family membrane protease
MYSAGPMERRLRISGILVILGLVVEALCLGWTRPIAFVVLACVGGALIGLGVLFFLYSLVSGVPHAGSSGAAGDKDGR